MHYNPSTYIYLKNTGYKKKKVNNGGRNLFTKDYTGPTTWSSKSFT